MSKQTAYMKSNYPRVPGDHYPTVDTRCVDGMLHFFREEFRFSRAVDMCAPQGSAIVNYLQSLNYRADGVGDAFADSIDFPHSDYEYIPIIGITNPPYKKSIVDDILWRQIERVDRGEIIMFATLMRSTFDHAKSRTEMFNPVPRLFWGKVQLCFRPFWTERRDVEPFHNFSWLIWSRQAKRYPQLRYYDAPPDPRYRVLRVGDYVTLERVPSEIVQEFHSVELLRPREILGFEGKSNKRIAILDNSPLKKTIKVHPQYLNMHVLTG